MRPKSRQPAASYTVPPSNVCARAEQARSNRWCCCSAPTPFAAAARLASLAVAVCDLAHLAVAHRPGFPIDARQLPAALATLFANAGLRHRRALASRRPGRIVTFAMTQLAISATQIRALLAMAAASAICCPTSYRLYSQAAPLPGTLNCTMKLPQLEKLVIDALEDIKGRDIEVIDTSRLTSLFRPHDHCLWRLQPAGQIPLPQCAGQGPRSGRRGPLL
jgi:hypothetical protein